MRNYEDLQAWRKAHNLTQEIYKSTRCFPMEERFGLTSQIRRSCSSIGANLAGGCGRRSDAEMVRFVQIAIGSGAELSHHLRLARDLDLLSVNSFEHLRSDLSEVMRMLSSLSQKLKLTVNTVRLRANG